MTPGYATALVVDPCEELVAALGRIEDVFLFADPETDEGEAALRAGARAAGELTLALRRAAESQAFYAPGGAELVPILLVQADLEVALGTLGECWRWRRIRRSADRAQGWSTCSPEPPRCRAPRRPGCWRPWSAPDAARSA